MEIDNGKILSLIKDGLIEQAMAEVEQSQRIAYEMGFDHGMKKAGELIISVIERESNENQ